jgi:hypothetical protein
MRPMEKAPIVFEKGDIVELTKMVEGINAGTDGEIIDACNGMYIVELKTKGLYRPKDLNKRHIVVNRHKLSLVIRKNKYKYEYTSV